MTSLAQRLKRHPFPVVAWFDRVVALSFAFPKDILAPLVPKPLRLDCYEGYGFVTVALVWTKALRPAGFPSALGQDFFLAGYRVFVRMMNHDGRRFRGLKILQSETDKARMAFFGNMLTHYNYRTVRVTHSKGAEEESVVTCDPHGNAGLEIVWSTVEEPTKPVEGSPFPDLQTARKFAGPMPFTFDFEGDGQFVVIEGRREKWQPNPVTVKSWRVPYFNQSMFDGASPILANAFSVRDIPYRWERGRLIRPPEFPDGE